MAWHASLQEFVEAYPFGALPPDARERSCRIARARFALLRDDPAFALLNWPNIEKGLDFFLAFEARNARRDRANLGRAAGGDRLCRSKTAAVQAAARGPTGSTSCNRAARGSSTTRAGRAGAKDVKAGFSPQLTLEAAMLAARRFRGPPPLETEEALYLKLGGAAGGEEKHAGGKGENIGWSSPSSISPASKCSSTRSPARRRPTSRARSPNSSPVFGL